MSQNNPIDKSSGMELIATINHVDGFDPSAFAVDYTDLNTGEVRKRLPIMPMLAWFRLKYPEGKIAVSVKPLKDCFEATAKISARQPHTAATAPISRLYLPASGR